ncbi:MAG: phage holin family protein, partial [Clostridiales bacterium]|nr:phage holin family protein [Clostridiales bacterium]
MEGFLEVFNHYAKSELMILVPVLFIINKVILQSDIKNQYLPLITSAISVALCGVYTFANVNTPDFPSILLAIFVSVTQGILYAGASIFGGLIMNPSSTASVIRLKDEHNSK